MSHQNDLYIELLDEQGGEIDGETLEKFIDAYKTYNEQLRLKYERYKASNEGVPIFKRELSQNEAANKINNKLNNDFFGEIVDTKIGYFAGVPISYKTSDEEKPTFFEEFQTRNNIDDLEAEMSKQSAICGYGVRLLYLNKDGQESVKKVLPFEAILIYDEAISNTRYGIRFYDVLGIDGQAVTKAEFYNDDAVVFFENSGQGFKEVERKSHLFGGCPLFGEANNDELQGDADKVLSLIDAYDRTLSDVNSEVEQFRLAYMMFKNMMLGADDAEAEAFMDRLRKTGGIEVGEDGDVKFITKDLNDAVIEHHLDRLEERIKHGAKTVDFTDESFGSASGISLKYKLFALETKCITAERKKVKSMRRMYELLSNSWAQRGQPFDANDLDFQFTRNVFVDHAAEAETLSKLKGQVSDETAFSLMSFIPDPQKEIEKLQEQKEEALLYFNDNLDDSEETTPPTDEGVGNED